MEDDRSPKHQAKLAVAYDLLKQLVVTGQIRPGDRLGATHLAKRFGFSITPTRDALARLAGEQLIGWTSNRGYHARLIDEDEQREAMILLFDLMTRGFERNIGGFSMEGINKPWELDPVGSGEARFDMECLAQACVIYIGAQFERFAALGGGNLTRGIAGNLIDRTYLVRLIHLRDEARLRPVIEGLPRLTEAVERGDATAATALLRRHLQSRLELLPELVREASSRGPRIRLP